MEKHGKCSVCLKPFLIGEEIMRIQHIEKFEHQRAPAESIKYSFDYCLPCYTLHVVEQND